MIPLANEQRESYEKAKIFCICKNGLNINTIVKYHCYYTIAITLLLYKGAAHSICNLKYSILQEIIFDFYNELNYDETAS